MRLSIKLWHFGEDIRPQIQNDLCIIDWDPKNLESNEKYHFHVIWIAAKLTLTEFSRMLELKRKFDKNYIFVFGCDPSAYNIQGGKNPERGVYSLEDLKEHIAWACQMFP